MDTPLIISREDFAGKIDVSNNLEPRRLNEHIRQAQDFDLCDLMGDNFYYYFMSFFDELGELDPAAPEGVVNLFNGGGWSPEPGSPGFGEVESDPNRFTFTPGRPMFFYPGIKPVLVYFSGARLVRSGVEHITPTGFMKKINEFSEPVSQASKSFTANGHDNTAKAYWAKNLNYMTGNKTLFPQYFDTSCGCGEHIGRVRPKMYSVGGNDLNTGRHGRR